MIRLGLILTAAALLAIEPARAAALPPTEIQVTGTGSISMVPDQAVINAAVVTNAPGSSEAVSQNNATYEHALSALAAAGIARSDVSLGSYYVQYAPRPKTLQPGDGAQYGFTVTRDFYVKTRAMSRAGSVVDTLVRAGVTSINNVSFGIADESGARAKALSAAVADARTKAESLAQGAGMHIVGIKTIVYGDYGRLQPAPMAQMALKSVPTQFDPGNQDVGTSVTVTYLASP